MNQDKLQLFPNQDADHRPDECVAYTVVDLVGNLIGIPCDPGFTLGGTFRLENIIPNSGGTDPFTGMQTAIVYGVLPTTAEDFNAITTSELYEANFNNYSATDKQLARTYSMNGVKTLEYYSDIDYHLSLNMGGAAIGMRWYESFNNPNSDGTLPASAGAYSNHCVAAYESTPKGLRIKSWQGIVGDGGYLYLNEAQFNACFYASYAFNPYAWRWLSLATIAAQHPSAIPEILPMLKLTK